MRKLQIICFILMLGMVFQVSASETRTITDMEGRVVEIPLSVHKVICSGPGCLRYLLYMEGQEMVVGVDSIEKRENIFDARPYALANPKFKTFPLFGEFRGFDNPELIAGLSPQPDVIFKTYKNMGADPDELQAKTGIPVICLTYGNLATSRQKIYGSLQLMGEVLEKQPRAQAVQRFFEDTISELEQRTANIPQELRRSCYIGGVAKKGPHGFQATEPAYPPFQFVHANNIACPPAGQGKPLQHTNVSKEQIVAWDPEIIFVDLATTQLGKNADAINELKIDPAYQGLHAVQEGKLFGVLPYNWYSMNYGSILADSFYIGKVVYPERFQDVDPKEQADAIYSFLVGKPVFSQMNSSFKNLAFEKIELRGENAFQ